MSGVIHEHWRRGNKSLVIVSYPPDRGFWVEERLDAAGACCEFGGDTFPEASKRLDAKRSYYRRHGVRWRRIRAAQDDPGGKGE